MTDGTVTNYAEESAKRLEQAEQQGLRLAIACRTIITGCAFLWYGAAPFLFDGFEPRFVAIAVLLGFTAIGIAHLFVIGTRFDRWWMKYAVYTLDSLAICATFALVPISRAEDIPQIIAFRAYGIYFLFPLLAVTCLSLSWRLVIWTGLVCVLGWWCAFFWAVSGMESTLSWADIPAEATRADYEQIFLSLAFIGRGNRIEETAMLLFATLALAVAVYRARAVFFAQVAADVEWHRERTLRAKVSDLLGKYVPEDIAKRLIADDAPLRPQRSNGVALVMDIADFTQFSAQHEPEIVIRKLDDFMAEATSGISAEGGIVMTYLGDGFLVTFNAPVNCENPQDAALRAAQRLLKVALNQGFAVRIGIATGDLVTGTIGSDTRQSFTVYGDAVNLAARLEAHAKDAAVPIVLDAPTFEALSSSAASIHLGAAEIRGYSTKVDLYGFHSDVSQ